MSKKPKAELTPKQEAFCQQYIIDLNQTQAAIRAGYSEKTANQIACQLLTKLNIQARVNELKEKRSKRVEVDADWVLERLKQIAGADMSDVADWNASGVTFKDSAGLSEAAKASIQAIEESTNEHGGSLKIKQHDKLKALEMLGRHLKLFTDKVEHSGKFTLEDLAAGSKEKDEK